MEVKVKATDPWTAIPARATNKSFGYDLSTVQQETVKARETRIIQTGLVLAEDMPYNASAQNVPMQDGMGVKFLGAQEGVAALVLSRSSTPLKHGLIVANAPGLIDADYAGPIGIIVHNLKDESVTLELGTRIAQLVFVRLLLPSIREVAVVDPARTRGGFGSTGK